MELLKNKMFDLYIFMKFRGMIHIEIEEVCISLLTNLNGFANIQFCD